MTNYDKIKSMNIDERVDFLAEFTRCKDCHMADYCSYPITPCLESEVDNNEP